MSVINHNKNILPEPGITPKTSIVIKTNIDKFAIKFLMYIGQKIGGTV